MAVRIQTRRGTAAEWTAANPVLAEGESGFEKDTAREKVGDGVTAWNALGYRDTLPVFTAATRPPANAASLRRLIVVSDPGVADELHVCLTTSDGGYEWVIAATPSY
jgi:hypothetical protein